MDELLTVLEDIKELLVNIDDKLNDMRGTGLNSLDDIYNELSLININTM